MMNYKKLLPVLALTLNAITFDANAAAACGAGAGGAAADETVAAPKKGIFSHNPEDHPRGRLEIYETMAAAVKPGSTVTASALKAILETDSERLDEYEDQLSMCHNMLGVLSKELIQERAKLTRTRVATRAAAVAPEVEKLSRAIKMVQAVTGLMARGWESALESAAILDGILMPTGAVGASGGAGAAAVATEDAAAFMESIRSIVETRKAFSKGTYATLRSAESPDVEALEKHINDKLTKYSKISAQLAPYGKRMHLDTSAAEDLLCTESYSNAVHEACLNALEKHKKIIVPQLKEAHERQIDTAMKSVSKQLLDKADTLRKIAGHHHISPQLIVETMKIVCQYESSSTPWVSGKDLIAHLKANLGLQTDATTVAASSFVPLVDEMVDIFMGRLIAPKALAAGAVEHNIDGLALPLHVLKVKKAKWEARLAATLDI